MNRKKVSSVTLAAVLTLSLTATALAANIPGTGGGTGPSEAEREANGDTTISILQAKIAPNNVSFTVPLLIPLAVVDSDTAVKTPANYAIANTTTADAGDAKYTSIAVTAMSFEKLVDSTFNTVADANAVARAGDLHLTIGGMSMPALATPGNSAVTLGGDLVDGTKPASIAAGAKITLPITGTVTSATRTEAAAVAQFRVKYTVSLLAENGAPLGGVYAGDDRTAAGLGEFVAP